MTDPDTSPEAVERLAKQHDLAYPYSIDTAATLRALSAALAEMTRRRDHWKAIAEGQDFTRVYLETCAERAALKAENARLRDALSLYSCDDGCNDCPETESDRVSCGWTALRALEQGASDAAS